MRHFEIDDDVVALIVELAKPEPFESLSSALRRFLSDLKGSGGGYAHATNGEEPPRTGESPNLKPSEERMRAPSPDPRLWVSRVPELRSLPRLTSWQAICEHFKIEVAGDSARRKLREWVKKNRPTWAPVPDA
jgi:hypothetical protein